MTEQNQTEAKPTAGHTFQFTAGDGDTKVTKTYRTKLARVIIPGVNDGQPITSLEISTDLDAQAYLVNNAVGSVIEEVIEAAE